MYDFDRFTPDTIAFLKSLKANNSREWFHSNRPAYEQGLKEPSKLFAESMCAALEHTTGVAHRSKIFRINRDLRFSKDKTPYNTHLHISFAPEEENGMWFFGLEPDNLSLGFGVFEFPKARLETVRQQLNGPLGARMMELTTTLEAAGLRIPEPALKRVPAGFEKDHPHSDALRRKGISAWKDFTNAEFVTKPKLVDRVMEQFRAFHPLKEFLDMLDL